MASNKYDDKYEIITDEQINLVLEIIKIIKNDVKSKESNNTLIDIRHKNARVNLNGDLIRFNGKTNYISNSIIENILKLFKTDEKYLSNYISVVLTKEDNTYILNLEYIDEDEDKDEIDDYRIMEITWDN